MIKLLTGNIWSELTKTVRKSRLKSVVAVAYFGKNAANMLPLSKGSVLLVDASVTALKNGQTCPDELLKLYYKGVHIYSVENLHAKLFIIGNTLYCGSTNVSGNSANRLKETLLKTTDKKVIDDAKIFINSLCRVELGDEEISRMNKFYKPPKFFAGPKNHNSDSAEFHICKLGVGSWTEEELEQSEKGKLEAEKNRINKSRHIVDEFKLPKINFKKGDNILQIIDEGVKTYIAPIGKLIHIRKWSNGAETKYFCYLEIPDKRRKSLETVNNKLSEWDRKSIQRAGKKNIQLETRIKELWK